LDSEKTERAIDGNGDRNLSEMTGRQRGSGHAQRTESEPAVDFLTDKFGPHGQISAR
jgi:hypothetical protein